MTGEAGALSGRRAVVTGASGGIGRAVARRLAAAGASVVVHYASGTDRADETVALIRTEGGSARTVWADLRDLDSISDFIESCGTIDILVNNAGVARGHSLADTSAEEFDTVFDTNVRGTFFLTRAALPALSDGGAVVTMSSMVSVAAYPSTICYGMSKAALNAFTRALAVDLAPRKITVNAVAPGATDSSFIDSVKSNPAVLQRIVASTALGRLGRPEDVARVVEFLVSPAGSWVTGQVIQASGGMHL